MNHSVQAVGLPPAGRFALLAALFSSVGQTFFIGLFGADFRAEFELSDTALGTIYSGATLVSGLSMFWLGGLADHLSLRRAVVLVLLVLAGGAALISVAGSGWMLLPGLFLVRLAGQGLMGHLGVVAAGRYALRRRGRALAMVSYGFILGEACFPPLVALLLDTWDWRLVWLSASLIILALGVPVLYWLARPLVGNPAADQENAGSDSSTTALLMRRSKLFTNAQFLRVLTIVLVPPVLITALFLHQGAIAERQQWLLIDVGKGFVLFAMAQALAAFLSARLIDRFSARVLLRFQLLPAALGLLSLGLLASSPSLWVMFAGLGITAGLNGVIAAAIWVELFGTRQLGMIRGVYAALMVLSTALGPIALGALLDFEVSLLAIGLAVTAYAVLVPMLAMPGIGARRTRDPAR
ncbi:MAG: MFS transporter [Wenzhouxiangellaceae bacterium]|nr:MFS transporter [Wenzhouxiangellaceae bacterium]